ncbi:MAG: thiamine phosphate synthase [Candidatus Cryptobacteroides sp.]
MIQFISHQSGDIGYLEGIRMALEGGCRWIQLRMKDSSGEEVLQAGIRARQLCDSYGAKLILDDHVELVEETGADGVHLGKSDLPIAQARALLGRDRIIGGTANTFEDVLSHWKAGADYIGCGPFRFTTTKKNLSPILGLEGYRDIISRMEAEGIRIPLVAIGGITAEDIPKILGTGVSGIAVSGTVLRAADPAAEMAALIRLTDKEHQI